MKLTKYLVSSAAAVAVVATLSLAHAQTATPVAPSTGNDATAVQQQQGGAIMPNRSTNSTTPGMMNNGTATSTDTYNSGTAATGTMNGQRTARTNRRAPGTTGTDMNSDGTMSTERVARADRG